MTMKKEKKIKRATKIGLKSQGRDDLAPDVVVKDSNAAVKLMFHMVLCCLLQMLMILMDYKTLFLIIFGTAQTLQTVHQMQGLQLVRVQVLGVKELTMRLSKMS